MKTTENISNKGNDKLNTPPVNAKAENKSVQPTVNGMPVSKEFDDKTKTEAKAERAQVAEQAEALKAETAQPQTEQPTKKEEKQEAPQKVVLNLESTLKLVEELHRRKIQRDRLMETIDTLEAFEVAQIDDADETEANHFQGCVLTIEDNNRRKFTTKNPVIIEAVAQFVNAMCVNRLAEMEAGITIPA